LGEGGAESSKAAALRDQPPSGELVAKELVADVLAKVVDKGLETYRLEQLRAAAQLPLPDDSDQLFHKLVSSLIATDPKRAIALLSVPESKSFVDSLTGQAH
jgi:hypothetical protein